MSDNYRLATDTPDLRRLGIDVLCQAQHAFMLMDRFRRTRERCKQYNYGNQWSDTIVVDGQAMTEEAYIRSQGNIPLKNNLIRRLVRNVIGVFRSQSIEPTCIARDRDEQRLGETMSTVLQYNMQLNRMAELYARSMEEFLISGLIVHRKSYGWRNDKMDCWTDYVQPNNFFVDSAMRDFRAWDCSLIGEIHDISFDNLCSQFARSAADYAALSDIYRSAADSRALALAWTDFGAPDDVETDFLVPADPSKCRVIEVWRKESKPRYRCHDYLNGDIYKIDAADLPSVVEAENARRLAEASDLMAPDDIPLIRTEWFIDEYWHFYFLTPTGRILVHGETPYAHRSHPYVFKAYPFIDGEIHSFVADIIDQQRYTNRLITLYDWIMRSSAKGVLMVPQDSIPKGTSLSDFARTWAKFNGVVVYSPSKSGQVPHQVANNSTNVGINELLSLQLKFFEDISGIHGALQGKQGYSGMSAALYSQQTNNATMSLLDILEVFNSFMVDSAYKDVKNIQQFYDRRRVVNIAGNDSQTIIYDPRKIQDVEFDLSIVPSTSTPAYRALANEFLLEIWKSGQITLEQMLSHGSFPFADRLLQSLKAQQEQMQQAQMAAQASGQQPQDPMAAEDIQANPQAVAQLSQALSN